jgi:hypothetical protein
MLLTTCCKKNPSKNPLYEKIKMFKNGPFMVEFFVIIGSFDYDCTLMSMNKMDSLNVVIEL